MQHAYAGDEDDTSATFHSARASSFCSSPSSPKSIDVVDLLEKSRNDADDDNEVAMRESVGGNSGILFNSPFVDRFTRRDVDVHATYGDDDCISRTKVRRRSTEQERLQRYLQRRMLRPLREDDNGSTYLAVLKHNRTRTLYAIKVMPKDQGSSKFWAAETERNVLKSLDHPFLPALYADVESEESAFLVMDFCPRGDLRGLLQSNPLVEEVARIYAAQVLLAMEYLHAHGIVHRGLKPENVLIKAEGHIMLSGFDHAAWRPPPLSTTRTSCGPSSRTCFGGLVQRVVRLESEEGSVGDVLLVPPEVLRGEEHDAAADWYTYGVFLYELLFGRAPIEAHDGRTTCISVAGSRRRLKFPGKPVVSRAARDLVRSLLDVNPKRRLGGAQMKQHAFFHGINFALLQERAAGYRKPPQLPNKF